MFEVHWVSRGADNMHGKFETLDEAQKSVLDWWKKNDYTPSYLREWRDSKNVIVWDYGSHISFYHFVEVK